MFSLSAKAHQGPYAHPLSGERWQGSAVPKGTKSSSGEYGFSRHSRRKPPPHTWTHLDYNPSLPGRMVWLWLDLGVHLSPVTDNLTHRRVESKKKFFGQSVWLSLIYCDLLSSFNPGLFFLFVLQIALSVCHLVIMKYNQHIFVCHFIVLFWLACPFFNHLIIPSVETS